MLELDPDDPVAEAIQRANLAFARKEPKALDKAYRDAVQLAAENDKLREALRVDHAGRLHALGAATPALARCDEYLRAGPRNPVLLLIRAEVLSSIGDHSGAKENAAQVRAEVGDRATAMDRDDHARLLRVEGLAAAEQGDLAMAAKLLGDAHQLFSLADDQLGADTAARDLARIMLPHGALPIRRDFLPSQPRTAADHLVHALVLKQRNRYEEAIGVVLQAIAARDLDKAMRLPLLAELFVLLHLSYLGDVAERLRPMLDEAAAEWPDPVAADKLLARLSPDAVGALSSPRCDLVIQHARRLIEDDRLDEAEPLLTEQAALTRTDRDICTWHLAAGELELAKHWRRAPDSSLQQARGHFERAARCAGKNGLIEVRILAVRLLGDCWAEDNAEDQAVACWAEAHRAEEQVANLALSDNIRVGMLRAAQDEHDGRIRAAVRALDRYGTEAAAGIVVALEAARGATILPGLFGGQEGVTRDFPAMGDVEGAQRWLREITRDVPRSQLIWLSHAAKDRVHHALIGSDFLVYTSTPADLHRLEDAVVQLRAYGSNPGALEESVANGAFDEQLGVLAAETGIGAMVRRVPRRVRRIAVVAAGMLADVPFAALVPPGTTERVGLRFALSNLPCLAVRRPLRLRSLRQRGGSLLPISPPGAEATPEALRNALKAGSHNVVRIDSHGEHDPADAMRSWLQLSPDGPAGQLTPDGLRRLDLSRCGTLILGACDSGMAQSRGKNEPVGFVRAALHAGAASVVAARWKAEDIIAAAVLKRFEHHLRALPRDLALHRAQLDVSTTPGLEHPAFWACWTLFGDTGFQTSRGPIRRAFTKGSAYVTKHQPEPAEGIPVVRR